MRYVMDGQEMKQWEQEVMDRYQIPSLLLMEHAAQAVVQELLEGDYDLHRVFAACGTGNNGGDGLAVARLLMAQGVRVDVCVAGELEHLSAEAKTQIAMYQAMGGSFVTAPVYEDYTVMVDALFGIGCSREITGVAKEVILGINGAHTKVVAVDIPSGIHASTGAVCGCAVRSDVTVTFQALKAGMLLGAGREFCGQVKCVDIGIPKEAVPVSRMITYEEEDLAGLPQRKDYSNKGDYGKVLVMAGSPKICGAAYLCAAAAYGMGAGLVKIYTPKENMTALQGLLPEALLEIYDRERPMVKQLKSCLGWADVIAVGPGFGVDRMAEKLLKYVISRSRVPVVIDADGLNLLAKNKTCLMDQTAPVILTPHVLEMARLVGREKNEVAENLASVAAAFTKTYPVTLVLKDARTLVAEDGEAMYVNTSGNPGMATGGSGDVLTGVIAALLGQKLTPLAAARLGVYLHGLAGDRAREKKGAYSMLASDIIDGIAEVTRG